MIYIFNNELYHHGIKGQRWGVRRFQDSDGSLTSAGKLRYYGESAKQRIGQMKEASYVKRDAKRIVGRPIARSQQSKIGMLDRMGGRKIGATYETRVARGKELNDRGRSRIGAIGRHWGRTFIFGIGAGIALNSLNAGSALANAKNLDKVSVGIDVAKGILGGVGAAYTATSLVRTYQDISDIGTYREDQKQKRKK